MKADNFQGYTNHATWVVNLWLTNTPQAYDSLREIVTDRVFFKTLNDKVETLREYVTRNIIKTPLYENGEQIQLDAKGENWPLGIVRDFDEDDNIKDVNWAEIIENQEV